MDAIFDALLGSLAATLGLDGASLLATLAVISLICRLAAKWIPDDQVGFLGVVRKVCKVLGLYVSNRISGTTSVTDVSKAVMRSDVPARTDSGKFSNIANVVESAKLKSSMLASMLGLVILVLLSGCTTTGGNSTVRSVTQLVCNNVVVAQALLDQAAESKNRQRAQVIINALTIACPFIGSQLDYRRAQAAGVVGY